MNWAKITANGVDYRVKDDQFTIIHDEWQSYSGGPPIQNITFSAELENGDIVVGLNLQRGDWTIHQKRKCPHCGEKIEKDVS